MSNITKLENQWISVEVQSDGAEMGSLKLKEDNVEYFWQRDPQFWMGQAPLLFPVVGKLKNFQCKIDGKVYNIPQHGFARSMNFTVEEQSEDYVRYSIHSNEDTLVNYPYQFVLEVCYRLKGKSVSVEYIVRNQDDKTMYFSIGAHPGFNCPLLPGEEMSDYYLEFETKENAVRYFLVDGLIPERTELVLDNDNILNLSHEMFREDALVLKDLKSNKVTLKSSKNNKSVTLEFAGFPYLGIWSRPSGAPYVCLEPWYGVNDYEDSDGELAHKEGIQKLAPSEEFRCVHTISIT